MPEYNINTIPAYRSRERHLLNCFSDANLHKVVNKTPQFGTMVP